MTYLIRSLMAVAILFLSSNLYADTSLTKNVTIDFSLFEASGFSPAPTAGQLDSDNWSIIGFTEGDLDFGKTQSSGDLARGISSGGESTGGLYAFDVQGDGSTYGLGIQPTASDFTPGALVLKLDNKTEYLLFDLDISYDLWELNNENRSTQITFSYSFDNLFYHSIPQVEFLTGESQIDSPVFRSNHFALRISKIDLEKDAPLYFKWSSNDWTGTGSRDEFAIAKIVLAVLPPSPLNSKFKGIRYKEKN